MTLYSLDVKDRRHHAARAYPDLADWLAELELRGLADRTREAYEQTAAFLLRDHLDKAPLDFTTADLTRLLARFPRTARHIRQSQLGLFTGWLERTGRIESDPMDGVPKIRPPRRQNVNTFKAWEQAALEGLPGRNGALCSILFWTGVRRDEASQMQVKHVQFERSQIVIPDGKGSKGRLVPMDDTLAQVLAKWFLLDGLEPNHYLWPTNDAGVVFNHVRKPSHGTIYNWWRKCLEAAGVDPGDGKARRTLHSTRHTFATNYMRAGGRAAVLKEILGHESIKTTVDLYVHVEFTDAFDDLRLMRDSCKPAVLREQGCFFGGFFGPCSRSAAEDGRVRATGQEGGRALRLSGVGGAPLHREAG